MDAFIYRECRATISARIPDTPDADAHPDRVLVQGRGTAHPQFQGGSVVFTEIGEYAIPQPIPVVIVDGELLVEVLAGDESVETQPLFLPVTVDERANQNWSWRLVFDFLTLGEYGEEVAHPPLSFPVEAGDGPLEISTVATPAIKTAGFVTRGLPGAGLQDITAADGEIVFSWDNGKSTSIDMPVAVPGQKGDKGDPGDVRFEGIDPGITVRTDDVLIGDTAVPSVEAMQEATEHTPRVVSSPDEWRLAETDDDGKISRAVDAEGRTWLTPHPDSPGMLDPSIAEQHRIADAPDYAWAITDEAGRVALGVTAAGGVVGADSTTTAPYDVVLVVGQSNAVGFGRPQVDRDPGPGIDQFPAYNKPDAGRIVPAVEPLQHQGPTNLTRNGFLIPFARKYRQEHPGRRVLLVPSAYGGTGFFSVTDNTWDWTKDPSLARHALQQTKDALAAAGPDARLVGVLWHQGELGRDADASDQYAAMLDGFIQWLRDELDEPTLPFVTGQISMDRDNTPGHMEIDAAHQQTPARMEYTAFVPSPKGLHNPTDVTHFSTRAHDLLGIAFYEGLKRAEFNASGLLGPIGVENVHAVQVGSQVRVSWDPAWARVTEYRVEWRDTAGTWTEAGVEHPLSVGLSATIQTTAAVEVRVTSINPDNESTPVVGPVIGGGRAPEAQTTIPLAEGWRDDLDGEVTAYRSGNVVSVAAWRLAATDAAQSERFAYELPLGYKPAPFLTDRTWDSRGAVIYMANGGVVTAINPSASVSHHSFTFITNDPMPTGDQS